MTTKYSKERKEAIINKMLPPSSMSLSELAKQENIPYGTLSIVSRAVKKIEMIDCKI